MDKVEIRRNALVTKLEESPLAGVAELASAFGVTKETIRRDLKELEKQGLIMKIRGGAALSDQKLQPIPYSQRQAFHQYGKSRIAQAAWELLEEGDIILLEGSTTVMALCREMIKHPSLLKTLTAVTNSLYIAQIFRMGELVKNLFMLGGWMAPSEGATQGTLTVDLLQNFLFNKAFLGGAALDVNMQLSAYYENDINFQQQAISHSQKTIVLLDSGKYPTTALFSVSDLSDIQYLVTDASLGEREKAILAKKNVSLICVPEN